jgi:hypothetical protein
MTVTSTNSNQLLLQRRNYIPWSLDWSTSSYLKVTGNAVSGAFEHRRSNYLFDTPRNLYVAPNLSDQQADPKVLGLDIG